MATIRTAIELEDRLSGVLNGVLNSVNVTVSAIEKMNGNLNRPIESTYFEEIRNSIARTSVELGNLNEDMERMAGTAARVPAVPHMQPSAGAVEWQTDNLNVFTNTGIERFKQEIQSAEAMLRGISESQLNIAANSEQTSVFPAAMTKDMQNMQARITAVQNKVREIGAKPINLVTAADSAMLEQLRGQLAGITNEQESLNAAVEAMDVSEANQAYLRLSRTVGNTERYIRDNAAEQERFNRKIDMGISGSDKLMRSIKGIAAAYISVQSLGKVLGLSDELTQTTARLNMMNDGQRTTAELQEMIFQSAQRSRGSYKETADAVAKLGLMAGNAFGSSAEVVAFMEQVNKQFRIAGTGADGVRAAMLQLTQAMGSGVLRGEEFNSIFEQAPTIMQSIAGYLDVPIGKLRDMAAEGEITAGVVKAAMFAAAEETNAKFESMPMTFEQVWTSFENRALMAFQPVLEKFKELANSERFQTFVDNSVNVLSIVAETALNIFNILINTANVISDNWSVLEPIIMGVVTALGLYYGAMLLNNTITGISSAIKNVHAASLMMESGATFGATAAQYGFNTALLACPITWIIILIIALIAIIYAVVAAINKFTGSSISATEIICGSFMAILATVGNVLIGTYNLVIDVVASIYNFVADIANAIGTLFNDPLAGVVRIFVSVADFILSILQALASAIDTVFGTSLADGVQGWRNGMNGWVDDTFGEAEKVMEKWDPEAIKLDRIDTQAAFNMGAEFGAGIDDAFSGFDNANLFNADSIPGSDDFSDLYQGVYNIDDNTGDMADSLSMTDEELKYLRDIAERETINRFTTAEITIEQTNNNNISSDNDLDGIVNGITDAVAEAVLFVTEGVHA